MNDEMLWLLATDYLSKLLQRPLGRGMRGPVEMSDPTSIHLHDDENVEQLKTRRDAHEEIAGENGLSMIPNEGPPALGGNSIPRSPTVGHIASDRPC